MPYFTMIMLTYPRFYHDLPLYGVYLLHPVPHRGVPLAHGGEAADAASGARPTGCRAATSLRSSSLAVMAGTSPPLPCVAGRGACSYRALISCYFCKYFSSSLKAVLPRDFYPVRASISVT